ncbi:hypothetical protein PRIPAC_85191 [Pristionchus pacificus]|uniref:G protein-coupled receptor n=1 Tax=Pristionchus pacificus TaxID=54126 RepID=A0A2A6BT16_PRIPA|nr:hypothetical protein PRIPAC_85191 [Pristionchus pacificus]|eukprot:PDM69044.1 G protein-coupled receptor [Pristionchus pacificus]
MLNEEEIAVLYLRSGYMKFLMFFRIITSSFAIALIFTMECYQKKFLAHKSMKLLMDCHAFWTLILCIAILIDHSMNAITYFSAKVPTDILQTTSQCLPRRLLGAVALYGSVSSMLAMAMERRAASINAATYERAGRSSGYLHALIHLTIVCLLSGIVWLTYGYPSRTPHCTIVTPKGLTELNVINLVLFLMEISTILIFWTLLRRNKKMLSEAKFKITLTQSHWISHLLRYQLTENIRMLKLFLPVVGSHTSITVAGLMGYFCYQLIQPGPEYYPMFEDTINIVYMQGVFMPIIFFFRYRLPVLQLLRESNNVMMRGSSPQIVLLVTILLVDTRTSYRKGVNCSFISMVTELQAAEIYFNSDYLRILVHIRIATASSGVILMCTMEFYRNKFVAHKSLKLLMTWHALWTLLYCSSILIDSVLLVITDYSATVPEDILLTSAQCLRRRLPDALALYGSVTSMFAMALERRSASLNLATYERTGATGGYVYVAFHLVIVTIFGIVMGSTYEYPTRTPHCSVVTPRGLPKLNIVNICLLSMEIATIIIFAILLRGNQKILSTTKFNINLTERYQLTENIRMLKLFLPVVGSHTTITVAGLVAFFFYQLTGLGPEYYPMFESTINFVYMQGVFMPIIFLFRYRQERNRERDLFSSNEPSGATFESRYKDVIQKGW